MGRQILKPQDKKVDKRLAIYGLLIENNQLLLIESFHSKKWEIPGGMIDVGESEFAALKREVLEETGFLVVDIGKCITILKSNFFADDINKYFYSIQKFYLINKFEKYKNKKIDKYEIRQKKWFAIDNQIRSIIRSNQIQVIDNLKIK